MNPVQLWLDALRSGEYQQTTQYFHDGGHNFNQIADVIESRPEGLFFE